MKKMFCLLLVLLLTIGSLSGCSGDGNSSKAEESSAESVQEASKGEAQEPVGPEFSYPMDGTVTLTMNMDTYDLTEIPDYAQDYYFWEKMQENMGIQIEFIGAASGPFDTTQEFLLLLASGEYPDIFCCNWVSFPGGPLTAMNDGYIQPLDQYTDWLPNLSGFLEENPDIDRMIRTDDGQLYSTPWLREDGTNVGTGLVIREDWLDQVNMEVPETIDEMYAALKAFKDDLGVAVPMTFELRWLWLETASASISSPFDVVYPYYVDGEEVKFGPLEEGYREFVETMAQWYKEGLLDTDLATVDKSTVQAKFANGEAGAAIQQSGNVQNCIDVLGEADPSNKVTAVPTLVKNAGDTPKFSHFWKGFDGGFQLTMSTQTENAETVCRFMDYSYSPEGIKLCAYGTEGVSYEADENGEFAGFTDLIMNNPNGDSPSTARGYFAHPGNWAYPGRDLNYLLSDEVLSVMDTWQADMGTYVFPPVTYTTEESSVKSAKYSTLDTYCRENITKFILGTTSMEEWDNFLAEIESLGAQELLALEQAAYDRYMAR